jgi:hypothetical protein
VRDAIGYARLIDRGNRVAASHDRRTRDAGDRARNRVRAGGEFRVFEDSHRAVPDHGLRIRDHARIERDRLRADIHAHAIADALVAHIQRFAPGARFQLRRDDVIDRQAEP